MRRRSMLIITLLAFIATGCTDTTSQSVSRSVRPPQQIHTVTADPTTAPAPPKPSPSATVLGTKVSKPTVTSAPKPAARTGGLASYQVQVSCVSSGKRSSGTSVSGGTKINRVVGLAGKKLTYDFKYQADTSTGDPIVSWTESCTMKTVRLSSGTEPRLAALLSCQGNATYGSGSGPTSAIAKSWRELSDLTGGFTHKMSAPKKPDQISESTVCTLSIARR